MQRVENAHHFHRHHGARSVVGGAGRGGPRIEMAADHHHFIFQLGVDAGNFRNRIEAMLVVAGEFSFHIHLHRDRNVGLE